MRARAFSTHSTIRPRPTLSKIHHATRPAPIHAATGYPGSKPLTIAGTARTPRPALAAAAPARRRACLGGFLPRLGLPAAAEEDEHAEHRDHQQEAPEPRHLA